MVDLLRVIAAFGVIAIHVHADTSSAEVIGLFFLPLCVPFFFTASLVYFVSTLHLLDIQTIVAKQIYRLLIPYLAWTFIYMLMLATKNYMVQGDKHFVIWRMIFYGESAVQMYYLPDLLVLQTIVLGVYILVSRFYINKAIGAILLITGIAFFWIGNYYQCFGVAGEGMALRFGFLIFCGYLLSSLINNAQVNSILIVSGVVLTIWSMIIFFTNWQYEIFNYPINITLSGPGLMLIAIGFPVKKLPNWILNLSRNSYGIYLCHVVFLEVIELVISKVAPSYFRYTFLIKIAVIILVFVLSLFFTSYVRRFSLFKRLLLGEEIKTTI